MSLKGTLLFLFLIACTPAMSQFKNMMIDKQSGGDQPLCEPTIAINPRHPENMVVGAVPHNVYYTHDGGKTWQKEKLPTPVGAGGDPVVVADQKGNFYYFHLSGAKGGKGANGGIVVQLSDDGGATWSAGEPIGSNTKVQDKEWVTVDDKGNLYVAWTEFDQYKGTAANCASKILFSMSRNGKKWEDPIVISQRSGNCMDDDNTVRGAVPAVTSDGKVLIAWSNQGKIFLDRSFNGGEVWLSNDIVVDEHVGGSHLKIPGHGHCNVMPMLRTDQSESHYQRSLYIVWADQRNGKDDTDIWFTRSHDYGDHWSSPTRINDDGKGKHQYLPSMAVDEATGYLYIVYYDRRNHDDLQTDVYLAYSVDGGASFENVLLSEKSFTPQDDRSFGDYNHISAHEGTIVPVWTRMDEGKSSIWTSIIRHEDLVKATAKAPVSVK